MKQFLKQYWRKLLLSSAVILLPVVFGLLMWRELPERMVIHWGVVGAANVWTDTLWAVLLLPLILLVLQWLCVFVTALDNRKKEQHPKVMTMVLWIVPVLSLYVSGMMYAFAFGLELNLTMLLSILMGIGFILFGNYLPKCRQNRTMGIKIKWALANEENWNATHRFGGKVWVIGGMLMLLLAFLPMSVFPFGILGAVLLLVILPTAYSYGYAKKQIREGRATAEDFRGKSMSRTNKAVTVVVLCLVGVLLVIVSFVTLAGEIEVQLGEDALTVEADFYGDLVVDYEDIDTVEFRAEGVDGHRINGFGSPRLLMGWFQNEEFGSYTRYTYTKVSPCVVLCVEGQNVVIGCKDAEATEALYEALLTRLPE